MEQEVEMMKTYTQEDVLHIVEDTIQKMEKMRKDTRGMADSYLDDTSDRGFRAYWFHKGVSAGLSEAVSTLDESKRQLEDEEAVNLKPCPCCGSTWVHTVAPDNGCYCLDCGLTMPNRQNWRERWNKRVKE